MTARGEIWWADLPQPAGSEPGYRHPIVIIQSDEFNRSSIRTVVIAAITSSVHLAHAPGNVLIPKKHGRLPKDSVVNVSQIMALDKSFLAKRAGRLTVDELEMVEDGLRHVLALA